MSDKPYSFQSEELKTLRTEAQKTIGQSIVSSLIKKEHYEMSDFQSFLGSTSYYNQSGGNYTQSDGGGYTQNGGGNYTQSSPSRMGSIFENVEVVKSIMETAMRGK